MGVRVVDIDSSRLARRTLSSFKPGLFSAFAERSSDRPHRDSRHSRCRLADAFAEPLKPPSRPSRGSPEIPSLRSGLFQRMARSVMSAPLFSVRVNLARVTASAISHRHSVANRDAPPGSSRLATNTSNQAHPRPLRGSGVCQFVGQGYAPRPVSSFVSESPSRTTSRLRTGRDCLATSGGRDLHYPDPSVWSPLGSHPLLLELRSHSAAFEAPG